MKFGHFDDLHREYVITNPVTPWPWINYLGNNDFYSLISNSSGGYAFYRDAKFRRLTRYRYNNVPMDNGGRYFYINDQGTVWSPGWKPVKTKLDAYECRHGLSYTRITGSKNNLEASVLFFVPLGETCEIQKVTLRNTGNTTKQIKLFSFLEWCLWNAEDDQNNLQRNLNTGEVEIEGSTLYHKTEYRERRDHYAFYHVNEPINGFDTDRESFIGLYNDFAMPQAVAAGAPTNSIAHGWSPIASHYLELTLEPGDVKELVFMMGYIENAQDEKWEAPGIINKTKARALAARFDTVAKVETAFACLKSYWDELLANFTIKSADEKLNRMVNIWNQYQCMVTFNMSRSASFFEVGIGRGMGFRDSNQDIIGFVHQAPARARERILEIAATQFENGGAYHQYQPLTKRGNNAIGGNFNDDPLWLILSTAEYLKETGDFGILNEMVAFDNDESKAKPLFDHLNASFNYTINHLGPHKLPLIGRADWNDCLNLNCFSNDPNESFQTTGNKEGATAESLMIAGLFVLTGEEFARICTLMGNEIMAGEALKQTALMTEAVKEHGWDGDWFLRAYDFFGKKIGSHENEEGQIFIESQGWCSMAAIGKEEGLITKALDSVKERLDCPFGIVLNNPPFTRYHIEYGEISTYPQGYKENAGIFCHNNPWIMIAETVIGRGDQAWEYYRKISPAYLEDISELHKTEPYVYSQMIAGKDAFKPGEAKNSWLTGTAAWNFYAVTRYLLGIRPDYNELIIAPCLPSDLKEFEVTRKLRGTTFHIKVNNHEGGGSAIREIRVNNQLLNGNRVPYQPGNILNIEVTMGNPNT